MIALERGTLYGVPVYFDRRVPFGPIDPESRETSSSSRRWWKAS